MFALAAGATLVHVPYRGSAPALNDLLSGQVDMMFDSAGNSLGHVATGALRALATGGAQRSPRLPDLPTMIESGFPDFVSVVFYAVVAPAGTPASLCRSLATTIAAITRDPDVAARLAELGNTPTPSTPDEAAALLAAETRRWGAVITAAGIRAD
jgi:tripartite-type tricarboxylate transporter receptor subunit TctC